LEDLLPIVCVEVLSCGMFCMYKYIPSGVWQWQSLFGGGVLIGAAAPVAESMER